MYSVVASYRHRGHPESGFRKKLKKMDRFLREKKETYVQPQRETEKEEDDKNGSRHAGGSRRRRRRDASDPPPEPAPTQRQAYLRTWPQLCFRTREGHRCLLCHSFFTEIHVEGEEHGRRFHDWMAKEEIEKGREIVRAALHEERLMGDLHPIAEEWRQRRGREHEQQRQLALQHAEQLRRAREGILHGENDQLAEQEEETHGGMHRGEERPEIKQDESETEMAPHEEYKDDLDMNSICSRELDMLDDQALAAALQASIDEEGKMSDDDGWWRVLCYASTREYTLNCQRYH